MTTPAALAADLASFNTHLSTKSYVNGYKPTSDDAAAFAVMATAPDSAKFLNVARWFKHIGSFSEQERKAFAAGTGSVTVAAKAAAPAKAAADAAPAAKKAPAPKKVEEEEDEDDLFASDEEADRAHEELLKAKVAAHRAGKPQVEKPKGRSLIVFEIKPNEIETDLNAMALKLKTIEHPGIQNWGLEHKLIPVAYGIKKLAISVVVFDDDIDTEKMEDLFMEMFPDDIQSVDIAAMSKV